jgi:hypothetical protein
MHRRAAGGQQHPTLAWSTAAPAPRSSHTTSTCPFRLATERGVAPFVCRAVSTKKPEHYPRNNAPITKQLFYPATATTATTATTTYHCLVHSCTCTQQSPHSPNVPILTRDHQRRCSVGLQHNYIKRSTRSRCLALAARCFGRNDSLPWPGQQLRLQSTKPAQLPCAHFDSP